MNEQHRSEDVEKQGKVDSSLEKHKRSNKGKKSSPSAVQRDTNKAAEGCFKKSLMKT